MEDKFPTVDHIDREALKTEADKAMYDALSQYIKEQKEKEKDVKQIDGDV